MIRESSSLEAVWPEVRRRLLGFLHGRGLDGPAAEDVVQDVAVRVISNDVAFTSADDLTRWAVKVARNLAVDHWRAQSRHGGTPVEDVSDATAVDQIVEHRLRLEAVERSWPRLSERDRHALRSGVQATAAATRREGVRWAVQRHAARARLAAMVDGILGVLVWAWGRIGRGRHPSRRQAAALVLAPVALVGLVVLPHRRQPVPDAGHQAPPLSQAPVSARAVAPATSPLGAPAARAEPAERVRGHRGPAPSPGPYYRVTVGPESGPLSRYVEVGPNRPDDQLICVWNAPPLPDTCLDLPPLPLG